MYDEFAKIYDRFQDIDYNAFLKFYMTVFEECGRAPQTVIDLGCGSGSLTVLLSESGFKTIGIDMSEDMLALAQDKALEKNLDILLLCQDMTDFGCPFTADAVISSLDCINYLPSLDDVKSAFKSVYECLSDDGIFIFDINSEYKLKNILGNNTFVYEDDNAFCTWECGLFPDDGVVSFDLNFFIKEKSGKYSRYNEYQEERIYSVAELKKAAEECGFSNTDIYADLSLSTPKDNSERIFFVLEK